MQNTNIKFDNLYKSVKDLDIDYFFGDNYWLIHEENHIFYYKQTLKKFIKNQETKEVVRIYDKFRFREGYNRQYDRGKLCNDGGFARNPYGDYWLKPEYFVHSLIECRKWWFILRYGIIGYNDGEYVERGIIPYLKNKLRQFRSSLTY